MGICFTLPMHMKKLSENSSVVNEHLETITQTLLKLIKVVNSKLEDIETKNDIKHDLGTFLKVDAARL